MIKASKSSGNLHRVFWLLLLFVLFWLVVPISLRGQQVGTDGSFFTDFKAKNVGDLLTVIIFEDAQASNQSSVKTEETDDFKTKGGPGVGPIGFIPLFSADMATENKYDGKGSNSRTGSIKAKMTVEVVARRSNGDLAIVGSKVIQINSEKETITLSGIVRNADINPDNTIYSYNIANAQIEYTGRGPIANGSSPGILRRIINWFF